LSAESIRAFCADNNFRRQGRPRWPALERGPESWVPPFVQTGTALKPLFAHSALVRLLRFVAMSFVLGALSGSVLAWSNHALCTWPALAALPRIADAAPVPVERLEDFLTAEGPALAQLLDTEERWARDHVPTYPARPDALAFRSDPAAPAEARRRFLAALRINPAVPLSLYVQVRPGDGPGTRRVLAEAEVTTLKRSETTRSNTYVEIKPGETVPVIDVVATASDEPDHGFDIGLWEDSGTPYGRAYGFGKQPFGANPAVEFASQAPMHIGFFHEAAIVYKAGPFLQRTYPEYRIHLWQTLAAHALRSGHPYWGWRFAGWALHYIQDLTQPYHARVLPGRSVAGMLWINTLYLAGWKGPRVDAVTLVTNRHLALENYQLHRLRRAYLRGEMNDATLTALRDASRDPPIAYADSTPREVITRESSGYADALDDLIAKNLPRKYTSDPSYVLGETETGVDLLAVVARTGPAGEAAMTDALVRLLGNFGTHTRAFVRALPEAKR
jgi:hypothetical protein